MDPMSSSNGSGFAFGILTDFPHESGDAAELIDSLDGHDRELLKNHEGEFQSKEEVLRYLSHVRD